MSRCFTTSCVAAISCGSSAKCTAWTGKQSNLGAQLLAERLSLADAMEEFAENYSRGMKKKLGLICALLHEPALVVLDEPTNGLDPHGTMVLHDLMREIAAAGRTVLFSTHLLDQAERLCSRVAVIHQGQLAATGTLAELQSRFAQVPAWSRCSFVSPKPPRKARPPSAAVLQGAQP